MTDLSTAALHIPERSGILLVEDNPNDELFTRRALQPAIEDTPITVVHDGADALDYLFARGEHVDRDLRQQPALVILDIDLPKLSGLDVLAAIRTHPSTVDLPVIVSSSHEPAAAIGDSTHEANGYIVKHVNFPAFRDQVHRLVQRWLTVTPATA